MAWPLFIIAASTGVVALLLGGGWLVSGSPTRPDGPEAVRGWLVPPTSSPETAAAVSVARPASAAGPAPAPEVRDVTPATITPPPLVSGPLMRVEPPAPPAAPPEAWRPVVFHRPTIAPDLSLSARPPGRGGVTGGLITIRLAGILPLEDTAICKDALGDEGPCQAVAAAALRALIGAKGVACLSPRKSIPSPLVTTCRFGNRDLGAWLVERGYARATSPNAAATAAPMDTN